MANKKKITTRKIRGEKRRVEITKKKNGKESIRILDKKKPKNKPKKSQAIYDKKVEKLAKYRQRRAKKYEPKLKKSLKKMNRFQGTRRGFTKLFYREYNNVGPQANRDKLSDAYDRKIKSLRVKNKKKEVKQIKGEDYDDDYK